VALPTQQISPGRFAAAHREAVNRLQAAAAMQKMFSKDASLWQADAQHARVIANRLGWIGVLDAMHQDAANLSQFAQSVAQAGLRDTVLLGMGGSSLAPEVFALTFASPAKDRRFFVLDSTDPGSIRAVENAVDLRRTLFVVASKSGKTIETLSQFLYFHQSLQASGMRPAGKNFVAITDPGSYLAQLASERGFLRTFLNPADIGGRYSALSYFGLVPAALWGANVGDIVGSAMEMREACGPSAAAGANPAMQLGALLGTAAAQGSDKLILLSTPSLVPLGNWIEQLIAESTGKQGKGIVPVAGGVPLTPEIFQKGCVVAVLAQQGEDTKALEAAVNSLAPQGVPVVQILLGGSNQLGAEFFKWEAATAVAGAVLAIDPFDEPNVQESKDRTAKILEEFQAKGQMPVTAARLRESGIELYAEGATSRKTSTPKLTESLRTFFDQRKPGDYVSLLVYVARNDSNAALLGALREDLARALALPVLLGYGPRYLHSIGQLYKGGPSTGMFLVITAAHPEDVPIPGAKYTFGQLQFAQALGDFESLSSREKPVLRLHLSKGAEVGLPKLQNALKQALSSIRVAGQ
jgi:glucose-6-phosphate isomerase/transaldolase/glucose-6-phosphate isomerase